MRNPLFRGAAAGLVTGLALGFLLKAIQTVTGSKVYTLLLNVDFVPGIPQLLPEWIEFALHLLVSIGIGIAYTAMLRLTVPSRHPILTAVLLSSAVIPAFFPLTALSERTPAVGDFSAFIWWTVAHLIYGLLLGIFGLTLSPPFPSSSPNGKNVRQ